MGDLPWEMVWEGNMTYANVDSALIPEAKARELWEFYNNNHYYFGKCHDLEKENARLRKALEVYGNENSWDWDLHLGYPYEWTRGEKPWLIATEALKDE